ncbi:16S rRNA (uracil(1498)-N(3))-methyltransferase [bacterium]|nr:16S rRNA (uracil(1498)-N(3))-methyltransferase [bacterium]
MKIHRFFVAEDVLGNDVELLDESVVHQISRVLRMKVGERVALCDGRGTDAVSEIIAMDKKSVSVRVLERIPTWVPQKKVHVFLAPIRKERFEWALEKCTELGVARVTPLITERSERGIVKRERAEVIMKEAAEQCGRGDVPIFGEPVELETLSGEYFVLDMGGVVLEQSAQKNKEIRLLIGPEGGWTEAEREFFKSKNWQSFSLGPTTLRAETAAVAACARVL